MLQEDEHIRRDTNLESLAQLPASFSQMGEYGFDALAKQISDFYIGRFDLRTESLEELKKVKGPKLLHVETTKGKGLAQAEADQVTYHAPGKFDRKTGDLLPGSNEVLPPKFQDVFGHTIVELAENDEKIIETYLSAITIQIIISKCTHMHR